MTRNPSTDFNSIEQAIEDFRAGKFLIVVDDEDRENEGDFVVATEFVTPSVVNFLLKEGRGVVCAPLTNERARELGLEPMVDANTSLHETPFTVSVDFVHGTTTGVSAADRAATIRSLIDQNTKPSDLARPGHLFPLRAADGGVLRRAGHTEAVIDLCHLAGLYPSGVLCEILNEDGTMARVPELLRIARKFHMKIITVKSLIEYRMQREKLVRRVVSTKLPSRFGDFQLNLYKSDTDEKEHIALIKG
ncbi:MAG: 3,4-dihydroxy-2-butanone-4-phosphate synthase, partial [Bacteroidota bacterium]